MKLQQNRFTEQSRIYCRVVITKTYIKQNVSAITGVTLIETFTHTHPTVPIRRKKRLAKLAPLFNMINYIKKKASCS